MNVLQSSQNTPVKPLGHKHVYTLPRGLHVAPFLHGHWEGAYKKVIILHFSLNILSYDRNIIKSSESYFYDSICWKTYKKADFYKICKEYVVIAFIII